MTTTAPDRQPSTPGQALRWYASREDVVSSPEGQAWAAKLRRWADELDAAPTTYSLPAEPAPGELWDVTGKRWSADPDDYPPRLWWCDDQTKAPQYWPDLLRRGPLSPAPPAGTEAD